MNIQTLPLGIRNNPLLKQWLTIANANEEEKPNVIGIYSGKVELGQGIEIALQQIAADALGVDLDQIEFITASTLSSPNEMHTAGSMSVDQGGSAVRSACRFANFKFIEAAANYLQVTGDSIRTQSGIFSSSLTQKTCTYWSLVDKVDLNQAVHGVDTLPLQNKYVGKSSLRTDLIKKLSGNAFIHDIQLKNMIHGRVIRGQIGESKLIKIDLGQIERLEGIDQVIHSGHFIAILGYDEAKLVKALIKAKHFVEFEPANLPIHQDIESLLTAMPAESSIVFDEGTSTQTLTSHQARFSRPYIAHASIGPACALASMQEGQLTVWSHSQGIYPLKEQLAQAFKLDESAVKVIHAPGSGCYGHNGADDVAFDAAFIAIESGHSVRIQWMREDDMTASPFGSAGLIEIRAGVDADNKISNWNVDIWSHSHLNRPGSVPGVNLLGAWQIEEAWPRPISQDLPLPNGGGHRNAVVIYDLAHQKINYHFIEKSPIRTSALRSLGSYLNIFAIESFMNELAEKSGIDPIEFRLNHLKDQRAIAVIKKVVQASNYGNQTLAEGTQGLGIGFGRYKNTAGYCAVIALIRVTEKIQVEKIWAAVDVGLIVNPDGLKNQIEGGIIQAISWTLKEHVQWNEEGLTTYDWDTYPILNFDEVPEIELHFIEQPDQASLGAGEIAAGPVPAAIGNALAHAIGIRARHLPLSPERLTQLIMDT